MHRPEDRQEISAALLALPEIKITMTTTSTTSPLQALKATGRNQYVNEEVAATIPPEIGEELVLFNIGKIVSRDDLEKEYEAWGLTPASALDLCSFDRNHRETLDEKEYVATIWKDDEGRRCYAAFSRWRDGRRVRVDRDSSDWYGAWWFAGCRKSLSTSAPSTSAKPSEPLTLISEIEDRLAALKKLV